MAKKLTKVLTVVEYNSLQRSIRRLEGAIDNLVGELNIQAERIDILYRTHVLPRGKALGS